MRTSTSSSNTYSRSFPRKGSIRLLLLGMSSDRSSRSRRIDRTRVGFIRQLVSGPTEPGGHSDVFFFTSRATTGSKEKPICKTGGRKHEGRNLGWRQGNPLGRGNGN